MKTDGWWTIKVWRHTFTHPQGEWIEISNYAPRPDEESAREDAIVFENAYREPHFAFAIA